jgi:hypothetical protein
LPWLLLQFGDACLRAGRPEEAIEALTDGCRLATANGERWCEPELLRVLGAAELAAGQRRDAAVARIRAAADLAAGRRHPGLELRAAITLAELGHDEDGRLARLAASFAEGDTTADLEVARALLRERAAR